jgi:hypothetical protein
MSSEYLRLGAAGQAQEPQQDDRSQDRGDQHKPPPATGGIHDEAQQEPPISAPATPITISSRRPSLVFMMATSAAGWVARDMDRIER